ncbi:MAG: Hybrid sensor histidine kinase, partial [Rhodospirillaceae bacterium]
MHDISDRVKAERIRDEGERALLDVIETSPVAVGITDHGGRFLYWNPPFFQLGRRRQDEKGNTHFRLVFLETGLYENMLTRIEQGDKIWNQEAALMEANDAMLWVLVSMQRMSFEGQPAVLTWLYDITRLKEQKQALTLARVEAERASRAKSNFLATMSHEIRTPMNGVITMSELLDQSDLHEGQRAMTTIIRDSATALLAIIDDVLDFSKIEAGRLEIEQIGLSLSQVVEGAAELLGPRAAEKGLELVAFIAPNVPDHLKGDPVRTRQVLLNLLSNAVKFTEKGAVVIHVSIETPGQEGQEGNTIGV